MTAFLAMQNVFEIVESITPPKRSIKQRLLKEYTRKSPRTSSRPCDCVCWILLRGDRVKQATFFAVLNTFGIFSVQV